MTIIPLYNESGNIAKLVSEVLATLDAAGLRPSIFLVDDGSSDGSLETVRALSSADPRIRFISLSRNFGKEAALMAGIIECGDDFDALAYMDGDGQHTAQDLLRLIEAAQEPGIDLVLGVRSDRTYQTPHQRRLANLFYGLFRRLSETSITKGSGDFNVMKPEVVRALRLMGEEHPFMKGLVGWIGFRRRLVNVTIAPRGGGVAKSSTYRMLKLAFNAIVSFSSWPLRAWSAIGIASAFAAAIYLMVVVLQTALFGREVPGYATTIVLLLGLGGLQLLSIGILGEYLSRVYDASKRRPRYIISEASR